MQPYCQPTSKSPPFSPIPLTFDPFVLPQVVFGSFDRAPGAILERISPEHLTANVAFTSRSVTLRMILQCLYTCYCYCNFVSTESVSKAGLVRLVRVLTETFSECDYWTRSNISKRVIGGYTAFKGEFPYQVAVLHVTDGLICGGSIITKKWVLSAAHCFDRYISSDDFRVLVGAINPTSGQLYDVLKIIQHENYERYSLENDIALLMTVSEIRFHSNVNRIVLEKCYIRAVPCITLGWGRCNFRVAKPLPKLRVLEMKTIPNKRCSKFFSVVSEMEIGMCQLCAIPRDRKKGLCFLDSGSPLVHKGKQIGILTSGTMCGKFPSVFTRISSFFHWISTTLKENRPDSSKSAHSPKNYTNERQF